MITNFKKIGEYVQPNQYAIYEKFIGKNKSKKIPIVYLLVVNNEIKYIGESRRGYTRPLSFNKNKVMNKQRKEIYKAANLKLIELNENDLKQLDDVMPKLLLQHDVDIY